MSDARGDRELHRGPESRQEERGRLRRHDRVELLNSKIDTRTTRADHTEISVSRFVNSRGIAAREAALGPGSHMTDLERAIYPSPSRTTRTLHCATGHTARCRGAMSSTSTPVRSDWFPRRVTAIARPGLRATSRTRFRADSDRDVADGRPSRAVTSGWNASHNTVSGWIRVGQSEAAKPRRTLTARCASACRLLRPA